MGLYTGRLDFAAIIAILLVPAFGVAQGSQFKHYGGLHPPMSALNLTDHEDVSEDLSLTPEQRRGIESIKASTRKEDDRLFAGIDRNKTDHAERPPFSISTENWRQAEERVVDLLTLPQRERLRALQWQTLGFRAIFEEDLQAWLRIDPKQLAAIRRFQIAQENESSQAYAALGNGFTDVQLESTARRSRLDAEFRAMALLAPQQVRSYRELLGKTLTTTEVRSQRAGG